jgi:hypothetical protein
LSSGGGDIRFFGKGEEGNARDDGRMVTVNNRAEQGRSPISFPYPVGAVEGTDAGTIIKERPFACNHLHIYTILKKNHLYIYTCIYISGLWDGEQRKGDVDSPVNVLVYSHKVKGDGASSTQ